MELILFITIGTSVACGVNLILTYKYEMERDEIRIASVIFGLFWWFLLPCIGVIYIFIKGKEVYDSVRKSIH